MRRALAGDMPILFSRTARYACVGGKRQRLADCELWQPLMTDLELPAAFPKNPSGLGVWVLAMDMFGSWQWQALVAFKGPGDTVDSE
jgi:hypothetical protein